MPERIQRRRTKGWKQPPNTLYVGRPTPWGNPFNWLETNAVGRIAKKRLAVEWFRAWLDGHIDQYRDERQVILKNLDELRQYDYLSCWCTEDEPCHADILLELLADA